MDLLFFGSFSVKELYIHFIWNYYYYISVVYSLYERYFMVLNRLINTLRYWFVYSTNLIKTIFWCVLSLSLETKIKLQHSIYDSFNEYFNTSIDKTIDKHFCAFWLVYQTANTLQCLFRSFNYQASYCYFFSICFSFFFFFFCFLIFI